MSQCGASILCIEETQSWKLADVTRLTKKQLEAVSSARAKQQELGKQLVTTLTASIAEKGFAESVTLCNVEAPKLTSGAQGEVTLGRTSHALRNPKNTAPEWAAETVAAKAPGKFVFRGPGGKLGVLSPIMTAEVCVNCHGPADKLAEGVPEVLANLYPEDQATGFEAGQLRGWFWAEVSPP